MIVGGVGFYARKEIRDVLAYIRLARNTSDNVSLLRIINTPTRGIGAKTVQTLQGWSEESEGRIWDSLVRALGDAAFPGRAHRALQRFREIIDRCRSYLERPLPILIEQVLEATDYLEALRREGSEESENRILNLQELVNVAREAEQADIDLQEFLDQISLRSDADDYDEAAPVTLMTLHNAKGLEFPVVFIVGCEEGLFPHSRAILEDDLEEERRLCYVGMTRAEKRLHLSHSKRRRLYGSGPSESNLPSQFLMEIPPDLTTELTSPRVQRYSGPGFPQPHVPFQKPKRQFAGKTYDTKDSVRQFLDSIPAQEKSAGKIVRGATVVHAEFGPGKVLHVEKTGKDLKVTVRFPGIGIKKMLQSYAKMRPV